MVAVGEVSVLLTLDRSKFDRSMAELQRMGDLQFNVLPKVDHKELVRLNEHLEKKKQHATEINRWFQSNPISVKTNLSSLDSLEQRLESLKNQPVTITVNADTADAESQINTFYADASREVQARIKLTADLEIERQRKRDEAVTRFRKEETSIIVQAIKDAQSKQGSFFGNIVSGFAQQIGFRLAAGFEGSVKDRFNVNFVEAGRAGGDYAISRAEGLGNAITKQMGYEDGLDDVFKKIRSIGKSFDEFLDPKKIEGRLAAFEDRLVSILEDAFVTGDTKAAQAKLQEDFKKFTEKIIEPIATAASFGLKAAAQPFRIRKRVLLGQSAMAAEEAAQNIPVDQNEEIQKAKSISLITGGIDFQKGGPNTFFTENLVKQILPESYTVPVTNPWSNDAENLGVLFDIRSSLIKLVSSVMGEGGEGMLKPMPLDQLLNVAIEKGFNPDSITLAATAMAYRQQYPDKPINMLGASGGTFVVEEAVAIAERAGLKNIKGAGLTAPVAGLTGTASKENFTANVGNLDPLFLAMFGGKYSDPSSIAFQRTMESLPIALPGLMSPNSINRIVPGAGEGHATLQFLTQPVLQKNLANFLGETIGPMKSDFVGQAGNVNLDFLRIKNDERATLPRTLMAAFGDPATIEQIRRNNSEGAEGYSFFDPLNPDWRRDNDLRGAIQKVVKKGKKTTGKTQDEFIQYNEFLTELGQGLEKFYESNGTARGFLVGALGKGSVIFKELKPLFDRVNYQLEEYAKLLSTDTSTMSARDRFKVESRLERLKTQFGMTPNEESPQSLQNKLQSGAANASFIRDAGIMANAKSLVERAGNLVNTTPNLIQSIDTYRQDFFDKGSAREPIDIQDQSGSRLIVGKLNFRSTNEKIDKNLEVVADQLSKAIQEIEEQIKLSDEVIKRTTGDAQKQYKKIAEILKKDRDNLTAQLQSVESTKQESGVIKTITEIGDLTKSTQSIINSFSSALSSGANIDQQLSDTANQLSAALTQVDQQLSSIDEVIKNSTDDAKARYEKLADVLKAEKDKLQRQIETVSNKDRLSQPSSEQPSSEPGGGLSTVEQKSSALSTAGNIVAGIAKTTVDVAGEKAEELIVNRINTLLSRTPGQPDVITTNPKKIGKMSDLTAEDIGSLTRLGIEDVNEARKQVAGVLGEVINFFKPLANKAGNAIKEGLVAAVESAKSQLSSQEGQFIDVQTIDVTAQQVFETLQGKFDDVAKSLEGAKNQIQSIPSGAQVIDVTARDATDNYQKILDEFRSKLLLIKEQNKLAEQRAAADPQASAEVFRILISDLTKFQEEFKQSLKTIPDNAPGNADEMKPKLISALGSIQQYINQISDRLKKQESVIAGMVDNIAIPGEVDRMALPESTSTPIDSKLKTADLKLKVEALGKSFTELASSAKTYKNDLEQQAIVLNALMSQAEEARALLNQIQASYPTGDPMRKTVGTARGQITTAITSAKATAQESGIDLTSTGAAIPEGIALGVKKNIQILKQAADSISGTIINNVEGDLGVSSPSRWAIYVMEMVSAGLKIGAQNNLKSIETSAKRIAEIIKNTVQGELGIRSRSGWAIYVMEMIAAGMRIGSEAIKKAGSKIRDVIKGIKDESETVAGAPTTTPSVSPAQTSRSEIKRTVQLFQASKTGTATVDGRQMSGISGVSLVGQNVNKDIESMKKVENAARGVSRELNKPIDVKKSIFNSIKDFSREIAEANPRLLKHAALVGAVVAGFIGFQGIEDIGFALKNFVGNITNSSIELERLQLALNFSAGGSFGGSSNLEFINQTVKELGIPLKEARQGFVQLSSATRDTSLEGQKTKDIFLGISQAVSALGLSSEDAQGVFTAFTQIVSKGTISAEELRQQLAERIPGAVQIAARAIGVTEAQLNKLLESGSLTTQDTVKIAKQLQTEFSGAAAVASNTLQGALNRLNQSFTILNEKALAPWVQKTFKFAIEGAASALEFLGNNLQIVGFAIGVIGRSFFSATIAQIALFIKDLGPVKTLLSDIGIIIKNFGAPLAAEAFKRIAESILRSMGKVLIIMTLVKFAFTVFDILTPDAKAQEWDSYANNVTKSIKKISDSVDELNGKKIKPPAGKELPDKGFDIGGLIGIKNVFTSDTIIRGYNAFNRGFNRTFGIDQEFNPDLVTAAELENQREIVARNEFGLSVNKLVSQALSGQLEGTGGTKTSIANTLIGQRQFDADIEQLMNERNLLSASPNADRTRIAQIDREIRTKQIQQQREFAPLDELQMKTSGTLQLVKNQIKDLENKELQGKATPRDLEELDFLKGNLTALEQGQSAIDKFNNKIKTSVSIGAELNNKFVEIAATIATAKEQAQFLSNRQLLDSRGTDLFASQKSAVTKATLERQAVESKLGESEQLVNSQRTSVVLGGIQDPSKPPGTSLSLNSDRKGLELALSTIPTTDTNRRKTVQGVIEFKKLQEELPGLQLQEADANQAFATAKLDQDTQRRGLAIRQDESSRTVDLRRRQRLLGLRDTDVAVSQARIGLSNTRANIESTETGLTDLKAEFDAKEISYTEYTKRRMEAESQLADLKKTLAEQELALQNTIGERALANLNLQNQKVQDQIQRTEAAQISGLRRRQRTQNLNPEDVAVEEQQIGLQSVDKKLIAEQNNLKRLNELRAKGEIDKVKFEDNERQALNNLSDLKKQKAEQELSLQNAINARIIENLERANQLAEASIKSTTTQRITDIKQFALLPGAGEFTDQAINRASGNAEDEATRRTIELKKVELEQTRKLFAERRKNPKELQDAEIRINQEILDLNQQRVDKSAALEKQLRDAKIRYIEESAKATENSIGREIELLRARQGLVQAQSQARLSSLEGQLGQTDRALGLAQKLRDPNLDSGVRSEITSQLNESGFGTDEEAILNRKFELENAIAEARERASRVEYENQLKVLELEFKKNELAAQREEREARRAQLDADQGQLVARDELRKAKKTGDPESIANAQKGVEIADEIRRITDIGVEQSAEGIKQAKELYEIELQTLQVKRDQTLEEERQAAIRRGQDQRLTRVENRASQRGSVDAFADGGIAQGMALVGERGPELAIFNQPTQILPAEVTRRILSDVNVNMDSTRVVAGITPNVSASRFSSDMAFHLMRMADAAEKMGNAQWNQSNSFTVVSERENSLDQVLKLHRGIMQNRLG